uniref:Uncharacterized protein n=1 Tax=Ralstonia solanacearum TaxID=305 RepID=A0A0S4WB67_RALSL|nr:protein of unknown function [Ralstonia solanacearum]
MDGGGAIARGAAGTHRVVPRAVCHNVALVPAGWTRAAAESAARTALRACDVPPVSHRVHRPPPRRCCNWLHARCSSGD